MERTSGGCFFEFPWIERILSMYHESLSVATLSSKVMVSDVATPQNRLVSVDRDGLSSPE